MRKRPVRNMSHPNASFLNHQSSEKSYYAFLAAIRITLKKVKTTNTYGLYQIEKHQPNELSNFANIPSLMVLVTHGQKQAAEKYESCN